MKNQRKQQKKESLPRSPAKIYRLSWLFFHFAYGNERRKKKAAKTERSFGASCSEKLYPHHHHRRSLREKLISLATCPFCHSGGTRLLPPLGALLARTQLLPEWVFSGVQKNELRAQKTQRHHDRRCVEVGGLGKEKIKLSSISFSYFIYRTVYKMYEILCFLC